jgi:hypothetical protein
MKVEMMLGVPGPHVFLPPVEQWVRRGSLADGRWVVGQPSAPHWKALAKWSPYIFLIL